MKIYIAGPYTKGDVAVNVRNAILAADIVLKQGHVPFVPHLTHFWHYMSPHEYSEWLKLDLEWLRSCDAVIRLPGDSSGADGEIKEARFLGLPIFMGLKTDGWGISSWLETLSVP